MITRLVPPGKHRSAQEVLHDRPVHIGQPMVPPLVLERQLGVVNPQAVQNRGVQVVDVHRVLGDVVTECRRSRRR